MIRMAFNLSFLLLLLVISACEDTGHSDEQQYRIHGTLTVGSRVRTYLLNLPANYYDHQSRLPLVIGMHGTGGAASQFEVDYHFGDFANKSQFIAVYPEGIPTNGFLGVRTWNAGTCCDYAMAENVDDVAFIDTLIDTLISQYNVDPKRVYVTGMSNGGMMAYRLACEIPEKIAAIATISCSMVVAEPCHPSRPVPILHLHSALDAKIPNQGGIGIGGYYFPPIDSVLQVWATENLCSPTPQVVINDNKFKLTVWSNCKDGTTVEYYLTEDGGHAWPGGSKSRAGADTPSQVIDANEQLWEFFQRFKLP